MRPLRKRLEEASLHTGLRLDILQQDYLLSWVLVGIFEQTVLNNALLFKGGTCLKKCYFGNYRFSQDLDFTASKNLPTAKELAPQLEASIKTAEKRMNEFAPIRLSCKKYTEKEPHPHNQEAFTVSAQFPWQREPLTKVMIEITRDETVVLPSTKRKLLHGYEEAIDLEIPTYSLEEIILEKLRAILQHTKKLHERDWNRSRARDYYDLWRILNTYGKALQLQNLKTLLENKCSAKDVRFDNAEAFFDPKMLINVQRTWQQWLGPLVSNLPDANTILDELKAKIPEILTR